MIFSTREAMMRELKIEDRGSRIEVRGSNAEGRRSRRRFFSILFPLSSILIAATGCLKETKPVAYTTHAPLIVDDAMQQRDWPRSVAHFANGETPAGPTEFIFQHNPDAPRWVPAITDGPMSGLNIAAIPISYLFTPPWEQVIYPSGVVEPTYNAMPPMPGEK